MKREGTLFQYFLDTMPSCCTNVACFWFDNAFVNPSAIIFAVGVHSISISPSWCDCRNQKWCISTCLSLVVSSGRFFLIRPTVCMLSQSTEGCSSVLNRIWEKSLQIAMVSRAVFDNANSSASVVDVVTVFCLIDCHAIGPLNNFIMYPCVERLVATSSANDASLATANVRDVRSDWIDVDWGRENSSARYLIYTR